MESPLSYNILLIQDDPTDATAIREARLNSSDGSFQVEWVRVKHINDSLGHAIGDRLLQAVARRLLACVRSSDTVSRQGGDEFVILLSEVAHAEDAAISAEKILEAERVPIRIDEHELDVTVSIGIVTYPEDGTNAEPLLNNVDFAMYHAKDTGRGDYQFFKPEMTAHAIERRSLEGGLRLALARQERCAIHTDRGRVRLHPADRPVGPERGLPPSAWLAARRLATDTNRRQRLAG
jgi:diguanylate cyclase (GGDEF)-like protein